MFAWSTAVHRKASPRSPCCVTIIGGMILVSLWIIGEYVGRIYEEVKRRPIYLVDRMVGGDADLSRLRGDRRL